MPEVSHGLELYTSSLLVKGKLELLTYRRVLDALNNQDREFILIRDGAVLPVGKETLTYSATVIVQRTDIEVVSVYAEAAPPTSYAQREFLQPKIPANVMIYTPSFALNAKFYHREKQDLAETLENMRETFFPVTEVTLFSLLKPSQPIKRAFASISRQHLVALYSL